MALSARLTSSSRLSLSIGKKSNADAGTDTHLSGSQLEGRLECRNNSVRKNFYGGQRIETRINHCKFVATEAGHGVRPSAALEQDVADNSKQFIAGFVSKGIVDLFEAIEVNIQQAEGRAIATTVVVVLFISPDFDQNKIHDFFDKIRIISPMRVALIAFVPLELHSKM